MLPRIWHCTTVPKGLLVGRLTDDLCRIDILRVIHDIQAPEPLLLQSGERIQKIRNLFFYDVSADGTVRARLIPSHANLRGQVENDTCDRGGMLAGETHETLAGATLDVGGVDDGESSATQAFGGNQSQQVERIA